MEARPASRPRRCESRQEPRWSATQIGSTARLARSERWGRTPPRGRPTPTPAPVSHLPVDRSPSLTTERQRPVAKRLFSWTSILCSRRENRCSPSNARTHERWSAQAGCVAELSAPTRRRLSIKFRHARHHFPRRSVITVHQNVSNPVRTAIGNPGNIGATKGLRGDGQVSWRASTRRSRFANKVDGGGMARLLEDRFGAAGLDQLPFTKHM